MNTLALLAKTGNDLHVQFGTLLLILVVLAIIALVVFILRFRRPRV